MYKNANYLGRIIVILEELCGVVHVLCNITLHHIIGLLRVQNQIKSVQTEAFGMSSC